MGGGKGKRVVAADAGLGAVNSQPLLVALRGGQEQRGRSFWRSTLAARRFATSILRKSHQLETMRRLDESGIFEPLEGVCPLRPRFWCGA